MVPRHPDTDTDTTSSDETTHVGRPGETARVDRPHATGSTTQLPPPAAPGVRRWTTDGDVDGVPPPPPAPPARETAGPPTPPPPSAPPAGGGRRPGLPLRTYLAIAATAALGAGAVVVPAQLLGDEQAAISNGTSDTAGADETPQRDGEAQAGDIVPLPGAATGSQVATIAERLLPSVMRIDVATGGGQGSGSGVVLDAEGHIVTNAHVVEEATEVTVLTPEGQRLDAEVVGSDSSTDIAVLLVDADDLPVPTFASGEPAVGELAVAIGSPFGLDGSVTSGIVSGLGRQLSAGGNGLFDLIQTDAAINPGNSGGALVNAAGEVVGINTAILSSSGANDGVGFAVPTATALDVASDLIEFGEVRAGFLGVSGVTVSPETAELYDIEADTGAIIDSVVPDSPADDAGVEQGDIVVALDGEPITTMQDLATIVRAREPDETITITVMRDGERLDLDLTLGTRPANP